ncbi:MAG TPA: hypothetical protein ENK02_02120 [Planctomycetes bacterium]|nr:hypothetical protein [Planctomycetota bacterium]
MTSNVFFLLLFPTFSKPNLLEPLWGLWGYSWESGCLERGVSKRMGMWNWISKNRNPARTFFCIAWLRREFLLWTDPFSLSRELDPMASRPSLNKTKKVGSSSKEKKPGSFQWGRRWSLWGLGSFLLSSNGRGKRRAWKLSQRRERFFSKEKVLGMEVFVYQVL